MVYVKDFKGNDDNEIIENAVRYRDEDGVVVLTKRVSDVDPARDYWLLDRAIVLPENTTFVLRNCKIKLSDKCRDNFFRSANCGLGIEYPQPIEKIYIKGEGYSVLEGADHPRSTGDSSKIQACPCPYKNEDLLAFADWVSAESKEKGITNFDEQHSHSYGTDTGKEGESQFGDWRNIGILLANVENFSIENVHIVCSHGWGISLEACAYGNVDKIDFDSCMSKTIDGMVNNIENQDGIDLRNGCHDITITNITGTTGDDVIALTAIASETDGKVGGTLNDTHVMHSEWTRRDKNIHNVIIRGVRATSDLCALIRLLPCNTRIWNVIIDEVIDTCPENKTHRCGVLIGTPDGVYGKNLEDSNSNVTISNVVTHADEGIEVRGYLSNSAITNVINTRSDSPVLKFYRRNSLKNVVTSNLVETHES